MSAVLENFKKYKEPILYVIVGGLTTAVNFAVYFLCTRVLSVEKFVSECIGIVISVIFAYFADKIFVFESKKFDPKTILKEASAFAAARLVTALINLGLFLLLVSTLQLNDFWSKIFINVIVIIGNYIFSKFFIFNNKSA